MEEIEIEGAGRRKMMMEEKERDDEEKEQGTKGKPKKQRHDRPGQARTDRQTNIVRRM